MQYSNSETPTVELNGETYQIELVMADNGSSTDKAPSAASDLIASGVSIVLGSYGSGVSMAAGPLFGDAGLAAMGVTCTNPNVTAGNDYYFRICFLDDFQANVLANFAMDKFGAKVAYCLGESGNEYDQGLISYFTKVCEAAGGKVISDSYQQLRLHLLPEQGQERGRGRHLHPRLHRLRHPDHHPGRFPGH